MRQRQCTRIRPSDRERLNQGMMKTGPFGENFEKGHRECLGCYWGGAVFRAKLLLASQFRPDYGPVIASS